jgi:Flp pilus assembly pilin Flp
MRVPTVIDGFQPFFGVTILEPRAARGTGGKMYQFMQEALSSAPRRILRDCGGQDLIEYALLASFVGVAVAAFFPLDISPSISNVFSKVSALLASAPNAPS